MAKITGVAHIAVRSKNLQESIDFYGLLGAKEVRRDTQPKPGVGTTKMALVQLGSVMLEIIEPADLTTLDTMKKGFFDHLCIGVDDLSTVVKELQAKGVKFNTDGPCHLELFGGMENINLMGPAGELLELAENKAY